MTQLDVAYRYGSVPDESVMRALDSVREVYGVRRITLAENERVIRVEFDASRLKEPAISALLRGAGVDLKERLVLACELILQKTLAEISWGGLISALKARGAQENLWPKFILWSAPLRATSSGFR